MCISISRLRQWCFWWILSINDGWPLDDYSWRLCASAITIKSVFGSKQNWILPREFDQSSSDSIHRRNLLISSKISYLFSIERFASSRRRPLTLQGFLRREERDGWSALLIVTKIGLKILIYNNSNEIVLGL